MGKLEGQAWMSSIQKGIPESDVREKQGREKSET